MRTVLLGNLAHANRIALGLVLMTIAVPLTEAGAVRAKTR